MSRVASEIARANLALLARLLPRVSPGHRSWIARSLMQDRYDPRVRVLAAFFQNAMMAWKNKQYDIHLNGERALLERLVPFAPRVVFDVGANVGEWSIAACELLPGATVHAFEIAEPTAEALARNGARFAGRLVVNRCGLSDQAGEVDLWYSSESSTAASTQLDAIQVGAADHGITTIDRLRARVRTGDDYLREQGIERVDLLKIDVEGAEPAVLRGFSDAFARGAIGLVQFEYGPINVRTRFLLADFFAFFEQHGYVVGKLLPEGVAYKAYEVADEDFVGPNYIACPAGRTDIIEATRCPPLTLA